jgi:hypothetical protein
MLKFSTVAKAADFPLQTRNDFVKMRAKAEVIGVNDFDSIRKPQRYR